MTRSPSPPSRLGRLRRAAAACALLSFPVSSAAQSAAYEELTDFLQDWTNLHAKPMTGLAVDSAGSVWAVNPYASAIVRFAAPAFAQELIAPTGLAPVSIAVWEPTANPDDRRILVACQGTHALFQHHPVTGAVLDVLELDSEPTDLVLDPEAGRAFVSCAGRNTVWQVELASMAMEATYEIPVGQRPGPLFLDRGAEPGAADNRVYVAAMITGNNSMFRFNPNLDDIGYVFDLDGAAVGLPDHDVYRIDPGTGSIVEVVRGAGSLLFDLERNPETDDLWILSQDSNNKSDTLTNEVLLSGKIATNQAAIVPGVVTGGGLVQASVFADLDLVGVDPPYDRARSLNQPDSLLFFSVDEEARGEALVASPFSDVIAHVDELGGRIDEYALPPGSQCEALAWYPGEDLFLALCLGSMRVEVFAVGDTSGPVDVDLPLGPDPTPDQIRRGRDVWFDGQLSADGRFSCATCHPGAMSDQLGWSLSGPPSDEKDVMVTQTLQSILDTFPHHWRGERDLPDFKKAFPGALGAPPGFVPSDALMDDLVVFFQSLRADANPIQSLDRRLDDSIIEQPGKFGFEGSAVQGQDDFRDLVNFNGFTCNECHLMSSGGTRGEYFFEVFTSQAPRVANLESANLRSLFPKGHTADDTTFVQFNAGGPMVEVNENGFGALHDGVQPTPFDFVFNAFQFFPALSDPVTRSNIAEFVHQWDNALAPVAHHVAAVDASSDLGALQALFVDAADDGWSDLVFDSVLGSRPVRWWYDARAQPPVFVRDAIGPSLDWAQLGAAIANGTLSGWFLGTPPGSGRALGIDPDLDGLKNGLERRIGSDPWNPDTDGDGWPDGHEFANGGSPLDEAVGSNDTTAPVVLSTELVGFSGRQATYRIRMSEPCAYTVTYGTPGGPQRTFEREYLSTNDTFVLTHEEGSTVTLQPLQFDGTVRLVDRAGNPSAQPDHALDPFSPETTGFQPGFPIVGAHVAGIEELGQAPGSLPGSVRFTVRVTTRFSVAAPMNLIPDDHIVWSIVAVDSGSGFAQVDVDELSHETAFKVLAIDPDDGSEIITDYQATPDEFLVAHTDDVAALGEATFVFEVPGVSTGDVVQLSVQGIARKVVPQNPDGTTHVAFLSVFQMQPLRLEDSMKLEMTVQ